MSDQQIFIVSKEARNEMLRNWRKKQGNAYVEHPDWRNIYKELRGDAIGPACWVHATLKDGTKVHSGWLALVPDGKIFLSF